jgi:hypothetical protein
MNDSLKISQNDDGSYEMSWDKKDPTWEFLNHLTNEQVQIIIKQAINEELQNRD